MTDSASKRQHEIIASAGKLLMEKGIKGLTTKNLAQEMGFSESALYRHFTNKEDIVVLLLQHLAASMKTRLDAIAQSEATASHKLTAVFNSQFQFFAQHPHFVVAVLSEGLFDESEKINQAILQLIQYKTELIANLFEEGKQQKEFNIELATLDMVHITVGCFRMMMLKWKFSQFQIDLIQQGNAIMATNFNLMKA
ncbi:TetR/AcrR family transcriptional regulator [Flavobacterium sp.]|uniref:TetR/AcrR family transcriptional regulator n=1 Tax=Flavobacterium sp. TaxID=239 RepID=UPI0025E8F403|nr:TetR/AcrR family transcriptional regulator [Flavobacterium sp.]